MANTIQLNIRENHVGVSFTVSLFFTSILLHHSSVIFGVNLSLADFFCIFLLLYLIINKQLIVPVSPLLFFIVVSLLVLLTASFYIPIKYMLEPSPFGILSDYLKLVAVFIYFLIGYNLSKLNAIDGTLKWYSVFGLFIGVAGVLLTVLPINVFRNILFFADSRYRGLMIDPNYFSVLQVTALVYITRLKRIKTRNKVLATILTLVSVLTSGSKTGIITFACYAMWRLVEYLFLRRKRLPVLVTQLFVVAVVVLLSPVAFYLLSALLNSLAEMIPSFGRVYHLLTDFGSAITEGGSGREVTWITALQVIQLSPLIGVGIGTYTSLAAEIFHYNNVAHNTFLQMTAEWGIPLAFAFFAYVFFILGKTTYLQHESSEVTLILRDIVLILLIGSMAISLNNARMLWLFLGALVFFLYKPLNKNS